MLHEIFLLCHILSGVSTSIILEKFWCSIYNMIRFTLFVEHKTHVYAMHRLTKPQTDKTLTNPVRCTITLASAYFSTGAVCDSWMEQECALLCDIRL